MDRKYFLATGLKGFRSTDLRVRFVEVLRDGRSVNVVTADLTDAGTPLTLDRAQLREMGEGSLSCPVCGESSEWCPNG